jgi:ATP-binding cassette subfamily B protein
MWKLRKYLSTFMGGVAVAIVLLFVQAVCDLNLPNLMSDIVNVGIQQNGIEHAAPTALSADGMKFIRTFMTEAEREITSAHYVPVDETSPERLYQKTTTDDSVSAELDDAFGLAAWTFINVLRTLPTTAGDAPQDISELDLTALYPRQALFDAVPAATIAALREEARSSDAALFKQTGIMLARAFATELGEDIGGKQAAYIRRTGLIMLLIALLGGIATVLVSLLSAKIATGVAKNLRRDVFDKIESFGSREFDKYGAASLITRCTNDVMQMQLLLQMGIRMICYAPIMGIGGIIMAVEKSASMSWILGVAVVAVLGMIIVLISVAMPKFQAIQKFVDKLNLVSRENLNGLMVIRAFGTQEYEKQRFAAANSDLTETNLFVSRIMTLMMPTMMFVMNGLSLLIIWVGARQIAASAMQVGDMIAYMQYAMQVMMSFMMLSMMFIMVPRAAVSGVRIAEVLETEPSIIDPPSPRQFLPDKKGEIEFKDVHFRYDGAEADALKGISFTALPGQTTAIIGSTGAGKSTIASLALRFYDVSEGQILVNGVDVREVTQKDLRSLIGYVPQKGQLLSGTISFNLKYGAQEISDEEMEEAAAVAQATGFIGERAERYEAQIAQGGANVSGGQKQRLSIARALAKNPEIIIFDDSFSALDFKTDAALRQALWHHAAGICVIVVAQRVSTIMNAEQIIVLDKGCIVGRGTHSELLRSCAEYLEIASSQLSKEELA